MYRKWTSQEIEYLEDNWGTKSIEAIGKELGRTSCGVQVKAQRMGLGRFTLSGDYITVYELARAINGRKMDGHTFKTWKKVGMPIKKKKVKTMSHAVVNLKDFWKWAETHREYLDLSRMQENVLGEEPEWAKTKRKWDTEKNRLNKNWEWTKTEDEKLKRMLERGIPVSKIAFELKRTTGAVQARKRKLGIEIHPPKKHGEKLDDEQKKQIKRLIQESCSYIVMSNLLQKPEKKIRTYVYKEYGTEDLDKVRRLMKADAKKESA